MTDYGYARVSTSHQDLSHGIAELEALGVDREYIETDKRSGKNLNRPGLQRVLQEVQLGDRLHVKKLDRLGRNLRELKDTADELERRGVTLVIDGTPYDPTTPMGRLLFNVFALFAEFERDMIAARTKAKLDYLREQGKQVGRKRATTPKQDALFLELVEAGHSMKQVGEIAGVSPATVSRAIARLKAEQETKADPELMKRRRKERSDLKRLEDALRAASAEALLDKRPSVQEGSVR